MVLTHEKLKSLIEYDPSTGFMTWRVSHGPVKSGAMAGFLHPSGYRMITVLGVRTSVHRLAYFYMYKKWPEAEVDHIDGVKDNNRWCNLREATHKQNQCNTLNTRNKSGFKGVSYHKRAGKWVSTITTPNGYKYLGLYSTPEDAARAYKLAANLYHGEFAKY